MAEKLHESLNPILGQAKKKKQLTWLHFYAPWCEATTTWRQELSENPNWLRLKEQMQSLEWNRDWSPEIDQGLQSFLQGRGGQQGWPVNVFLSPEGRAVFICGALKVSDFVELTRQLWVAWQTDPVALTAQAEKEYLAFRKMDPLALKDEKFPESADEDILGRAGLYRYLTPLEKSLQMDTGLIGVGHVFQYPFAYRSLLGFEDLGKWGELSLVRLARSPLNDVVGGGFFRGAVTDETVQDLEARAAWSHVSRVSTEKLLIDNAELLETYIEAHQIRKTPYLSQAAFELLDAILEDFKIQSPLGSEDTAPTMFASALTASQKFYDIGPEDLLKALPPKERQAAQLFFGIESSGSRIPRLPTETQLLSEFVNIEPIDLRLQLIDSRKRLEDFRKSRPASPSKCPPDRLSELTLVRVLAYAAFSFDTPQVSEICVDMLDRYREEWNATSKNWTAREKGAYLRALAAMARLHSAQRDPDPAQKCFEEAESLIFGLQDPIFKEAIVDVPFLGPRVDVCDHTGISGLASLLAGLLDYNALTRMGLRGRHNLPIDIGHTLSEGLRYARPLGIYASGLYWVLMRYQKLQQPEANA